MSKPNILWKSLDCNNDDLPELARHALELHAFMEIAGRQGLIWDEYVNDDTRDFGVRVPTEQLESLVRALQALRVPFGRLDCCSDEALAVCHRLGVDAERIVPSREGG
jgi:hypothetical protein